MKKIKGAGAIVIGKTNTSEFGTVPMTESILNGACRNPWDTSKTPGGSSGGAAAAVPGVWSERPATQPKVSARSGTVRTFASSIGAG